jgi:hypothetical protein
MAGADSAKRESTSGSARRSGKVSVQMSPRTVNASVRPSLDHDKG